MIGDVDGECFAVGMIAREGSFQVCEGMWAEVGVGEDLAEVGWCAEVEREGVY